MNFIERLLRRAKDKNISAKPKCGNYRIDIEYIKDGVKYVIIKNNSQIVDVVRNETTKKIALCDMELISYKDWENVYEAIENVFPDYSIYEKRSEKSESAFKYCQQVKDNIK